MLDTMGRRLRSSALPNGAKGRVKPSALLVLPLRRQQRAPKAAEDLISTGGLLAKYVDVGDPSIIDKTAAAGISR
jgi:hypothetical protein